MGPAGLGLTLGPGLGLARLRPRPELGPGRAVQSRLEAGVVQVRVPVLAHWLRARLEAGLVLVRV
jgi:hypothetical protein